ncbi:MAG: T9SS type A sorting domain-containing protein [Marinilabiliaceae bacterium]
MKKNLPLKTFTLLVPLMVLLSSLSAANFAGLEGAGVASDVYAFEDPDSEKGVQIWPNPATDVLNVKTKEYFKVVELLNMTGQIEKKVEVKSEKELSISVGDSPRGLYLLRVTPVSGERIISKVILK